MGKLAPLLAFVFFSFLFNSLGLASIYTCDSVGNEKTGFYTNDTVYITSSTNITSESKAIKFYVAAHRAWSKGTNLTEASNFSKNINTNSSGHVAVTILWSPILRVGSYDVIADINGNTTFDSEDLLYNASGGGFFVLEQPVPKLTISKGEKSPGNHDLYETNLSLPNEMLQVRLRAGSYEGVCVKSFYISASGSGDDKNGVKYVVVCLDEDEDGTCGVGEDIIGFGQYTRDDGIAQINLKDVVIAENSSLSLVFYYLMRNGSGSYEGKAYGFQLSMAEVFGSNTGNRAIVSGLPILSAVKTVYSQAITTTTTSNTTTTTTTVTTTTTNTNIIASKEEEEEKSGFLISLITTIITVVVIVFLIYFLLFISPPQLYQHKP